MDATREEVVSIAAGALTLEGRLWPGRAGPGVIITHPHPLFGGSLDNNVVWTAALAFQARGWATLRFNFRGVGASTGTYARGEGEVADVAGAWEFLQARIPGPCHLVGYSFGAYVAARALLGGLAAPGAWLIAPPVAFMDLTFLPAVPRLELIVVGDRDELCPLTVLRDLLKESPAPVEIAVIAGADHFFRGREGELFQVLRNRAWPSR
jgi:alpha/beta superfamily hydrolase